MEVDLSGDTPSSSPLPSAKMVNIPRYSPGSSFDSDDGPDKIAYLDQADPNMTTPALEEEEETKLGYDHSLSPPLNSDKDKDEDHTDPNTMDSRAYQLEMLHRSLQGNVIVAMDTGSGKTQVALLRIMVELEKSPPEKLIWFLAPTVILCGQQYDIIRLQIPSSPVKILTGNDNVDSWSENVWASVLAETRVVVSTPQVLYDALSHAYVDISSLALLIFDEAHNCVGKNAGSKMMLDFYHPRKLMDGDLPSILGLTASPIVSAETKSIEILEKTLDARCVTPTLHREELLKLVKRPEVYHLQYSLPSSDVFTPAISSLRDVYFGMNISDDPYIKVLAADPTERNRRLLEQAVMRHETKSQNQMKRLYGRSVEISRELGTWAADRYVYQAVTEYSAQVEAGDEYFDNWMTDEKRYIGSLLDKVKVGPPPARPQNPDQVSIKVGLLIQQLLTAPEAPVGIIFAQERATVGVLAELLSAHPLIVKQYRIGTMVGTSSYKSKKRGIYEHANQLDLTTLERFRSGKLNLLIATSVLEEGIDVPACNLVICFDQLATVKSFIQRRGRARQRDSRLVLFFEEAARTVRLWEAAEEEMKRQYQDEERQWETMEMLEQNEETSHLCFVVESTGARLDFDNAKQHLEHFCRTLSQGEFVDARPDYIVHRNYEDSGNSSLTATVLLPSFLPVTVRSANSQYPWQSEKNATKDAAFHAYVTLYRAGLLNDHLLPFKPDQLPGVETRAPIVDVEPPFTPWNQIAQAWTGNAEKWAYTYTCSAEDGSSLGEFDITLPFNLGQPRPIRIHRDFNLKWELQSTVGRLLTEEEAAQMTDDTTSLLSSHFGHRWSVEDKTHVVKVTSKTKPIDVVQAGSITFLEAYDMVKNRELLLRDQGGTPFLYLETLNSKPPQDQVQHRFMGYEEAADDVPYLVLSRWTKRADFLHPLLADPSQEGSNDSKPYPWVLPLPAVTVDSTPVKNVQFGMLLPSIIHELGVQLIVTELATTLLAPIGMSNLELVREAISSRSAIEPVNYERLEFLGDSMLKFCAAILVASIHPEWPEGYLSSFKDRLVSNSRLSRAAIERGLSKYILTKPFTGQKWRPLYLDDALQNNNGSGQDKKIRLSTKTLADVVEALIGAAYLDGGIDKATHCISLFIDEQEWPGVEAGRQALYELQVDNGKQSPVIAPVQELIGYTFKKKSLLIEALTHASYVSDNGLRSLERLEFIGDAVLDKIIVTKLFAQEPPLPNSRMHTLKTALVNGDFLAFIALESSVRSTETVVNDDIEAIEVETFTPLWKFMRHASTAIGLEQAMTAEKHQEYREEILHALKSGTHYPWAALARLQARKFFSDIIEALLGAVWIDSGSLEACTEVIERLGILSYLDHFLKCHVKHPKEVIGIMAENETVKYKTDFMDREDGDREYFCDIHVGDRFITRVGGGVNKEQVKTTAATEAVRILSQEGMRNEVMNG